MSGRAAIGRAEEVEGEKPCKDAIEVILLGGHYGGGGRVVWAHPKCVEKVVHIARSSSSLHLWTPDSEVHMIRFVRTEEKPPAGLHAVFRPADSGNRIVSK